MFDTHLVFLAQCESSDINVVDTDTTESQIWPPSFMMLTIEPQCEATTCEVSKTCRPHSSVSSLLGGLRAACALDRLGAAAASAAWAATVAAIPARSKDVGGGIAGCCGRCFGKFGFSFEHSLAPIGKVRGALEVTFAASQLSSCSSSLTAPGQLVGDVSMRLFFAF